MLTKYPGYDTKPFDCEASVLELWRMWSTPSLLLLSGLLRPTNQPANQPTEIKIKKAH